MDAGGGSSVLYVRSRMVLVRYVRVDAARKAIFPLTPTYDLHTHQKAPGVSPWDVTLRVMTRRVKWTIYVGFRCGVSCLPARQALRETP